MQSTCLSLPIFHLTVLSLDRNRLTGTIPHLDIHSRLCRCYSCSGICCADGGRGAGGGATVHGGGLRGGGLRRNDREAVNRAPKPRPQTQPRATVVGRSLCRLGRAHRTFTGLQRAAGSDDEVEDMSCLLRQIVHFTFHLETFAPCTTGFQLMACYIARGRMIDGQTGEKFALCSSAVCVFSKAPISGPVYRILLWFCETCLARQ